MSIFRCKMCGGTIEFNPGDTVGICDSCGTKQTLPRLDDDRKANLYDRANHFRRNNEFDKAMGIYEQILNEDPSDSEAYWSLVLCRYGIEYVEDPATHKRVPTVNRAQFTSIFDDDNYKSALQHADSYQRAIYEEEANAINEIQKGILAISQKEEPFDVFICYKETDANGRRTQDSVLANDLYHQLTQEGFKVFFSRITLEDKLGTAYEPYIFAALNSARAMVVLGTRPEYFNAVWVKNEWSRYLSLVRQSGGKKVLIPAYRDMDPYDLPEEFSHLQAQDMSKLGFMQDLIRGIKKIVRADEPKPAVKETVVVNNAAGTAATAPLLRRAFMFLEDGEWAKADDFCEQVLNIEPENAQAYIGKLLAAFSIRRLEDLHTCADAFENSSYQKAMRFGDDETRKLLEEQRMTKVYDLAVDSMGKADSESSFRSVAATFKSISGFRDADTLAGKCLDSAEECRKNAIYDEGVSLMGAQTADGYKKAKEAFESIRGWKDSALYIPICQKNLDDIIKKQEAERLEQIRVAEEKRIAEERRKQRLKKIIKISIPVAALCLAAFFLITKLIIPTQNYNAAVKLLESGDYEGSIKAFEALDGFKDSAGKIAEANELILARDYAEAESLLEAEKYEDAIIAFKKIYDYRDSAERIAEANELILARDYARAEALLEAGKYEDAIIAFKKIYDYRDSTERIAEANELILARGYAAAEALIESGDYENAIAAFKRLNGYKDSAKKTAECIFLKQEAAGLTNITVGSTIKFGLYEQDNNLSNGKEEIEWLVLAIEGNRALIISKYALDCQPYHLSYRDVTWETCSLREWLNGTFLNEAFTENGQAMIPSVTVSADNNPKYSISPGKSTMDQVFLLSITETNRYLMSDDARQCQGTTYCYEQGAYKAKNGNCPWWLRSPGGYSLFAAFVGNNGSVDNSGNAVFTGNNAVRPAMWIEIRE